MKKIYRDMKTMINIKKKEKYEVSPLELIFDLIFILAISKIADHLSEDMTIKGVAETFVFLIVFYNVWSYTSIEATLVNVKKTITHWMMLFVLLLSIFMTSGISDAFEEHPWVFVIPFFISQISHGIFSITNADEKLRRHYIIMTAWIILTTPLWFIGAWYQSEYRYIWWICSASIDLVGTWFAHPIPGRRFKTDDIEFDADHMLERCRLFLIIAIGEVIYGLTNAISHVTMTWHVVLAAICSFVSIISLWALYFWGAEHIAVRHINETKNPLLAARLAVNGMIIAVSGLIFLATGFNIVLSNLNSMTNIQSKLMLFGGPMLFILPQIWYLWYITKRISKIRIAGVLTLVISWGISCFVTTQRSLLVLMLNLGILTYMIIKIEGTATLDKERN